MKGINWKNLNTVPSCGETLSVRLVQMAKSMVMTFEGTAWWWNGKPQKYLSFHINRRPLNRLHSPPSGPTSKSHRLLLLSWCNHLAANPLNNFHLPTRSPVPYTYMHTVIKANCAEDSWYLNFHPCHQEVISSAPTYYTTCVHFVRAWLVGPWSAVLIRKIAHCLH